MLSVNALYSSARATQRAMTAFTPRLYWHYIRRTYASSAVRPRTGRAPALQKWAAAGEPARNDRLPIGLETTGPVVEAQHRGERRLLASYLSSGLHRQRAVIDLCFARRFRRHCGGALGREHSYAVGHRVDTKFETAPRRNCETASVPQQAGQPKRTPAAPVTAHRGDVGRASRPTAESNTRGAR